MLPARINSLFIIVLLARTILCYNDDPLRVISIHSYVQGESRVVSVLVENIGDTDITVLTRYQFYNIPPIYSVFIIFSRLIY